jgi:hypothetical protein
MLKTSKPVSVVDIELRALLDEYLTEDTQKLLGISSDMRIFDIIIKMCDHIENYVPPCPVCSTLDSLNNS